MASYHYPINLGNSNEYSILSLIDAIESVVPSSGHRAFLELPQDDPRQRKPDVDQRNRLLGVIDFTPLDFGILNLVQSLD